MNKDEVGQGAQEPKKVIVVDTGDDEPLDEADAAIISLRAVGAEMGMEVVKGKIEFCEACGLMPCACDIIAAHDPKCLKRLAHTGIPMPCDEHHDETCPTCYSCDCKGDER